MSKTNIYNIIYILYNYICQSVVSDSCPMLNIISQVSYSVQNPCPDTPSSSPRPNLHQLFFSDHAHVRGLLLDHWLALKLSQSFFGCRFGFAGCGLPSRLRACLSCFALGLCLCLRFSFGLCPGGCQSIVFVFLCRVAALVTAAAADIWLLLVVTVCLQS